MNDEDEKLLRSVGVDPATKLKAIDVRLWTAYARFRAQDPAILRDPLNRTLMQEGRLEYGEAALAREAPAARNTIASNRVRLASLLSGLSELENARIAARDERREEIVEARRTGMQKDRVIDAQASVIAAQMVQIHGLERRIAAAGPKRVNGKAGAPLGHRRRPAFSSAQPDPGASPAPQ